MNKENSSHIESPKSKNAEDQDILEQFNKKRKIQNKVLKKIVEDLNKKNNLQNPNY